MKLYEFKIMFEANVVIAANSLEAAKAKAKSLTHDEIQQEFTGSGAEYFVPVGDIDEPDVWEPDDDPLQCQAHFVVSEDLDLELAEREGE